MKQIALSIEQMTKLEELGLDTSDASMYWFKDDDFEQLMIFNHIDILDKIDNYKRIPAYTLQDILEKLPTKITYNKKDDYVIMSNLKNAFWYRRVQSWEFVGNTKGENLLDAAYNMLLWCIEMGILKEK